MISRRYIVSFVGLLMLPSRWLFARSQKQTTRQMMKTEGHPIDGRLTIYWAEDRRRVELLDRRKVIIERQDLKKIWVLNLDAKTYTVKAYEPMFGKATLTGSVIKAGEPRPEPKNFEILNFDPELFEVPSDFKASV